MGSVTEGEGGKLWSMAEAITLKRAFMPGVPSLWRDMHKGTNKGKHEKREEEDGGR